MLAQSRKKLLLLLTLSMTSLFLVLSVAFVGGGSIEGFAKRVFAGQEPVSQGTITFSSENATKSGTTNTTIGYSKYGSPIYCKVTGNDATQSSGHVGAVQNNSEIHFYESDGVTEYLFEDIDKISLNFNVGSPSFNLNGFYDDGRVIDIAKDSGNATRTLSFTETGYGNVARLWLKITSGVRILNSIILTYNCVSKVQTDVEVSAAPTKIEYSEGETFDSTGMIVKNVYSNGGKVATDSYTIYPSGSLSVSDTFVTISSNGFSTTQPITVKAASSSLSGTYTSTSYETFVFEDGINSGTYSYNSKTLNFTYSISGTNITFTFVSYASGSSEDDFFRHKLFYNSSTVNSTGKITGETTFTVSIQGISVTTRNFTKQGA